MFMATLMNVFFKQHCIWSRRILGKILIITVLFGMTFPALAALVSAADVEKVLDRLRQEIAAEPITNPMPIETVMARYEDKTGIDFQLSWAPTEEGSEAKPLVKPEQLSDGDWKAFLSYWGPDNAEKNLASENQSASFTFIDLDEDGQHDLIMSYYIGGTGLFSQDEFAQRDAKQGFRFDTPKDQDGYPTSYTINGRGADQAIYYLRIDGRSYVAYRDGVYAEDTLTLNRPLASPADAVIQKMIVVSYRYQHKAYIPAEDVGVDIKPLLELFKADPKLLQTANQQLQRLRFDSKGLQAKPNPAQRCPMKRTSASKEEDEIWPWRTAGHYTFDYVADFRIKTGKTCYSASIIAFKSSYWTSRESCCSLWLKSSYAAEDIDLPLTSIRMAANVELVTLQHQQAIQ
jgi:hypothetical protein